jgi:chitin disaccharide deacetylase
MKGRRHLIVTADDFGIGRATSEGILDLAAEGLLTGSVLLVTSPHAEAAVQAWRQSGEPFELGWHPCLTLDRPVAPLRLVPSLVDRRGAFRPLGAFLRRLWLGLIRPVDIETELRAQYERFRQLVGRPPFLINSHHHIQVFPPIGSILGALLASERPLAYLRRVQEPKQTLCRVPGARPKRLLLTCLGRREASAQAKLGFPGNDWLIGITNPNCVGDPKFLGRWLASVPGKAVELTCHPGYLDASLVGRDCSRRDAQLFRRPHEFNRLRDPGFSRALAQARFELVRPEQFRRLFLREAAQAA